MTFQHRLAKKRKKSLSNNKHSQVKNGQWGVNERKARKESEAEFTLSLIGSPWKT